MTRLIRLCLVLGCGIVWGGAAGRAADIVEDLSAVHGIDAFQGSPAARAVLKRNGFVVVRRFYRRIFSIYLELPSFGKPPDGKDKGPPPGLSPFVTADSVHRTFHVIFEDEVAGLERAMAGEVAEITRRMADALGERAERAAPGRPNRKAAQLARDYFLVAEHLATDRRGDGSLPPRVAEELRLVRAAAGPQASPLFGCTVDYSQFVPRSFYTGEPVLRRHFRTMMWYGQTVFRVRDARETRAAMIVAETFNALPEVRRRWLRIDDIYTALVGPCDDLTPEEYAGLARAMQRRHIKGDRLEWFRKHAEALRDPRINSMIVPLDQAAEWRSLAKGMRFFGPRYLPDSELFRRITYPETPGRAFPSGLDVLAANGSHRAMEMLRTQPDAGREAYRAALAHGRERFEDLKRADSPNHYAEFLRVLQTLTDPPHEKAPAFAKTPAYADKNLVTALAAWASMRHTWQLQAKQNVAVASGHSTPPLPGYVEPNPAFFQAMRRLNRRTMEILGGVDGVNVHRFKKFDGLLVRLERIVEKQFAGDPLSRDEVKLLLAYGYVLSRLQGIHLTFSCDSGLEWMGLVSDVHTEALEYRQCLEVATSGALPIYVVVDTPAGPQLLAGAVYSYHEFRQPMTARLTDEAWHRRCRRGDIPPMPGWAASYLADGPDAASLIARVRAGERVPELLSHQDPQVNAFLEEVIRPGSDLEGKDNYFWVLEAAVERLGKKAFPAAMRWVHEGNLHVEEEADGYVKVSGPAVQAAEIVGAAGGPEEIAALEPVVLGEDAIRARAAMIACWASRRPAGERLAIRAFRDSPHDCIREYALHVLEYRGSWRAVDALLDAWPEANLDRRHDILFALQYIHDGHDGDPLAFPLEAPPEQVAAWKDRARRHVLRVARLPEKTGRDVEPPGGVAYAVAIAMKLPEVVEAIRKKADAGRPLDRQDCRDLAEMGTPQAVAALLEVSRSETPRVRAEAAAALTDFLENAPVRARLTDLLADKTPLPDGPSKRAIDSLRAVAPSAGSRIDPAKIKRWRVCDRVALALPEPAEGPAFDLTDGLAERDAQVAAVRVCLAEGKPWRPAPAPAEWPLKPPSGSLADTYKYIVWDEQADNAIRTLWGEQAVEESESDWDPFGEF